MSDPSNNAPSNLIELDLTNSHLDSLVDVPLPPTLQVLRIASHHPSTTFPLLTPHPPPAHMQTLDVTANRLKILEPKLQALENLTWLCLRQNLIHDTTDVEALRSAPTLRHLELRDNQFTAIPSLDAFTSLTYLELSYNEIRSLEPLQTLHAPNLKELYVAQNKVAEIQGVAQLTSIDILELGSNRIKTIEGLDSLTSLRELWLGRNRIAEIGEGLSSLTALTKMSLQSNRLVSMAGVSFCTGLEELYLSHNGIEQLEVGSFFLFFSSFVLTNQQLPTPPPHAGIGVFDEFKDSGCIQ